MSTPIFLKSAATSWPAGTPTPVKLAVETFFQLLDGYTAEAAVRWSQLYHEEGEFQAFGKVFKGHEEIRQHILRFWASFPELLHTPVKVYSYGPDMMDLVVITKYEIVFSNNKTVNGESVALMHFVEENGKLVLRTNELILDPNPLMSGLASVSEAQIPPTNQQLTDKPTVNHAENVAFVD